MSLVAMVAVLVVVFSFWLCKVRVLMGVEVEGSVEVVEVVGVEGASVGPVETSLRRALICVCQFVGSIGDVRGPGRLKNPKEWRIRMELKKKHAL